MAIAAQLSNRPPPQVSTTYIVPSSALRHTQGAIPSAVELPPSFRRRPRDGDTGATPKQLQKQNGDDGRDDGADDPPTGCRPTRSDGGWPAAAGLGTPRFSVDAPYPFLPLPASIGSHLAASLGVDRRRGRRQCGRPSRWRPVGRRARAGPRAGHRRQLRRRAAGLLWGGGDQGAAHSFPLDVSDGRECAAYVPLADNDGACLPLRWSRQAGATQSAPCARLMTRARRYGGVPTCVRPLLAIHAPGLRLHGRLHSKQTCPGV